MKHALAILLPGIFVLTASACGGGESARRPRVELDPSSLDVTIDLQYSFAIVNTGDAVLRVTGAPTIIAEACEGDAPGVEPFALAVTNVESFPIAVDPRGLEGMGPDGISAVGVTVTYTPQPVACERVARVTIASDDPDRPSLVLIVRVAKPEPYIEANPAILDVGYVAEGGSETGILNIQNSGLGDLRIHKIAFAGEAGFSFTWGCERVDDGSNTKPIAITAQGGELGPEQCEPVVVPRNTSFAVPVRYQAAHGEKANALLTFFSNDPRFDASAGKGLDVELRANWGGPVLRVVPNPIDFGSVVLLKPRVITAYLESVGDETVSVTDVYLSEDTSDAFHLQLDDLGAFNAANPLVLEPGARRDFRVAFVPQSLTTDGEGKPTADVGKILVDNTSPRSTVEVPLTGMGVEAECAVCEFEVLVAGKPLPEGESIVPQTMLQFKDRSYDPTIDGGIDGRTWSVEAPPGSAQIFEPSPMFKDPKFQPNVIGEYRFRLEVVNKDGCRADCERLIEVRSPEGLHVEMTWSTPQDVDETDQCWENSDCGSDMDLHVVHPQASGTRKDKTGGPYGYFDLFGYDCHWNNKQPDWWMEKVGDPRYQPSLDLDDTDGAGPENFTYTFPEPEKCYRIGVHYYDDHGYGKSYPTVRVFIDSSIPVYEKTLTKAMYTWDMWDVGRVCVDDIEDPFEEFTTNDGGPVIETNYNPTSP